MTWNQKILKFFVHLLAGPDYPHPGGLARLEVPGENLFGLKLKIYSKNHTLAIAICFLTFSAFAENNLQMQIIFRKCRLFSANADYFLQMQIIFRKCRLFSAKADYFSQMQIIFY